MPRSSPGATAYQRRSLFVFELAEPSVSDVTSGPEFLGIHRHRGRGTRRFPESVALAARRGREATRTASDVSVVVRANTAAHCIVTPMSIDGTKTEPVASG